MANPNPNPNPNLNPNPNSLQVARRKFAFAREAAGYRHLQEGDGQEPVNAVYYKDNGDQYRPHCDGECSGGRYFLGTRLATGLSYCQVSQ